MIIQKIRSIQQQVNTTLCIGLDTDMAKLPQGISRNVQGVVDFNKAIIEATADLCCSYKINFAFYEQYGTAGFDAIAQTLSCIPTGHLSIADAKRGDIGNTSAAYANAILQQMGFDSITVSPYMGADSVEPFLEAENKLVFVLALTSNSGSADFQHCLVEGKPLYQHVIAKALQWQRKGDIGFVVGATHPRQLEEIRDEVPELPLLIPGVGTQGGSAKEIRLANKNGIALINVSRAVLYASSGSDFTEQARIQAQEFCRQLPYEAS